MVRKRRVKRIWATLTAGSIDITSRAFRPKEEVHIKKYLPSR
jgi:hypothetical protein